MTRNDEVPQGVDWRRVRSLPPHWPFGTVEEYEEYRATQQAGHALLCTAHEQFMGAIKRLNTRKEDV